MKKTPEDFDQRNEKAKNIEFIAGPLPYVSIGEFWRYREGINIGQEISKNKNMLRPCIIYRIIPHSSLLCVIPITTKSNPHLNNIQLTDWKDRGLKKESYLAMYNIKTIDKRRLFEKIKGKKAQKGLLTKIRYGLG